MEPIQNQTEDSVGQFQNVILPILLKDTAEGSQFAKAPIWCNTFNRQINRIKAMFLGYIMGIPNCVCYAAMSLETGQRHLGIRVQISTFKFWLQLHFRAMSI